MSTNENSYYIAVDLGATSGRLILAKYDGVTITTEVFHRFMHLKLPVAGHMLCNLPGL